ncbi:MAG: SH3 domain-containing protein [Sphingomonas bacterium]|nr:SH3 domain-containing protein [Sphingomonas bacterium]
MTGPSVTLDPVTHAVRGDLADVRLAEYVFAPHYAAPMLCRANRSITLNPLRTGGEPLADLPDGEPFEVLELAGDNAWGIAPERGLVGFVDRTALDPVEPITA